jgi:hypothetical protein
VACEVNAIAEGAQAGVPVLLEPVKPHMKKEEMELTKAAIIFGGSTHSATRRRRRTNPK